MRRSAVAPASPDWRWLCMVGVGDGLLTAQTLATVADAVSRFAPASARRPVGRAGGRA